MKVKCKEQEQRVSREICRKYNRLFISYLCVCVCVYVRERRNFVVATKRRIAEKPHEKDITRYGRLSKRTARGIGREEGTRDSALTGRGVGVGRGEGVTRPSRNKTTEILESAQYDSTTDREMKRNNVCVARNVGYPSLLSSPSHPLTSLVPRPNRGFVNIERVLASTVSKWPTFSRPLVRV